MLETAWESRWLPDKCKCLPKGVYNTNWFLPVIRGQKVFCFLMTDKFSVYVEEYGVFF